MRIVATVPTFNEAENILPLIDALLAVSKNMEVVVIDDDSPDGTWKIVEERVRADSRVHLVHRRSQRGRGSAGVSGFQRALEIGADMVVEMDGDWSHHPRYLPAMIQAAQTADVVVGSRLVPGGGEAGRHPIRTLITRAANLYLRLLLRLPVRDCTSGYRVFRRAVLEKIAWERIHSNGPAIVQEMLVACRAAGARFAEVPIHFQDRRAGNSTFNSKIALAGIIAPWRILLTAPPVNRP